MKARLISVDAAEWSKLLEVAPHDVYATPDYVALSAWQEGGEATGLLVENGDHGRLLIPLVVRTIDGDLRDGASPYGYPGIVTDRPDDDGFVRAALREAVSALDDDGLVSLFVRLHPLLPVAGLDGVGRIVRQPTVAIDLSQTQGQIWSGMRRNHRCDIRRAVREGYEFAVDSSWDAYPAFQRLYRATMARVAADNYYRFDEGYFDRLFTAIGDHLFLAVVRTQDDIAAAGLFTAYRGIVQAHLAAWDEQFACGRPTKLLFYSVAEWACERQHRWLHLGGGIKAADDSLMHFKAGFSKYRTDFGTLRVIARDDDYRTLATARDPAADVEDVTGFFPAYRAPRVAARPTILGTVTHR